MILHPDGRVEGTPEEVAAYKQRDILREQADAYREKLREDKDYPKRLEQLGVRMLKAEGYIRQSTGTVANVSKELTEEQVSSLSTYRLVEELSRRTGFRHLPILRDANVRVQIENGKTGDGVTYHPEVLEHMKYILIERD